MKTISETTLRRFLEQIAGTQSEELDCGQLYQLLDECVERAAYAREASAIFPLVEQHLGLCPDCHKECEMLLRILKADSPSAYRYAFWGVLLLGQARSLGSTYSRKRRVAIRKHSSTEVSTRGRHIWNSDS